MSNYNTQLQSQSGEMFPLWLQIVVYILLIAIALWIFKNAIKDLFVALFSKKVSVKATLKVKQAQQYVNKKMYITQGGGGVAGGIAEKGIEYTLIFEDSKGRDIGLNVTKDVYDVAVEGVEGTLVYKGKRYISFDGITQGTFLRDDINHNDFVGINKKF